MLFTTPIWFHLHPSIFGWSSPVETNNLNREEENTRGKKWTEAIEVPHPWLHLEGIFKGLVGLSHYNLFRDKDMSQCLL